MTLKVKNKIILNSGRSNSEPRCLQKQCGAACVRRKAGTVLLTSDMGVCSMGRWMHTRAALHLLQGGWTLSSSDPEAARLGLQDLPHSHILSFRAIMPLKEGTLP